MFGIHIFGFRWVQIRCHVDGWRLRDKDIGYVCYSPGGSQRLRSGYRMVQRLPGVANRANSSTTPSTTLTYVMVRHRASIRPDGGLNGRYRLVSIVWNAGKPAEGDLCWSYTQDMPAPMMQMRYDENSIPVSAKCSVCGEQMPQAKPRIANPIDNVAWFTAQFDLHVSQNHPLDPRKAFHVGPKKG